MSRRGRASQEWSFNCVRSTADLLLSDTTMKASDRRRRLWLETAAERISLSGLLLMEAAQ